MPADFDSAIVDLCLDRDCATVIETLVVAGSSVRPSASLPAGTTVYWRLRGRTGALIAGTGSPTWLFHVPTRDATSGVDTSGLPHLDINGDGLDDVAVGSPGASPMGRMSAGEVSLFYGNQLGLAQVPAAVLVGESAGDQFGYSVSTAGDVNGDGFGDLLIASPNAAPMGMINAGRVSVYLGSAAGLTQMPLRVYNGLSPADLFGYSVSSAGDVNADGFGDIIVGATAGDPAGRLAAGTADIYYGSTTGSNPAPNRILEGVLAGDGFGVSVAGAGDVNGDGFGDLFVGAWSADIGPLTNAGAVSTFHGSPTGIAAGAARVLTGPIANEYFGRYLAGAGDVNNDGFNDLLVGAYFADFMGRVDSGSASVFHGSVTGIESVASVVIGGATAGDYFGRSASGAGDVNGDGFDDIVVGAYFASPRGLNRAGTASVFLGGATGVDGVAARVLEGDAASDNLGISVASVGDLDGDKYSDIIVGSWGADPMGRANAGIASVFQGGIGGISMVPTVVLQGAAAGDNFGFCVANASEVSVSRRGLGWIIRRSARRARGRAEARLVPTTT